MDDDVTIEFADGPKEKPPVRDALLISGGLDSIAIWRILGCPPAVFFAHGQRALPREQRALQWAVVKANSEWGYEGATVQAYVLHALRTQENGYVPYRNALFILATANYTAADRILIGQVAEWAPDKNLRFYKRLQELMRDMTKSRVNEISEKVTLAAPFAHLTKGQLLQRYADEFGWHHLDELVRNTWSCYRLGVEHCGDCSGCHHRASAEYSVFGELVTGFAIDPDYSAYMSDRASTGGVVDGGRWVRDNGVRSLIARGREAFGK